MNDYNQKIIPAFYQVSETIRRRIDLGVYTNGEFIPTEKELEAEFSVSNITIRKALDILAREGLLKRSRGAGTMVQEIKKHPVSISITGNFRDWFDSASGNFPNMEVEVLDMGLHVCPERIRKIFKISKEEKLWRLERIRRLNSKATSYYINYAPLKLFEKFSIRIFRENSFLETLRTQCGVEVVHIGQTVNAIIADIELANILEVDFGLPLFFAENIYKDKDHNPLAVTHMYYRSDYYTYKANINIAEDKEA